MTNKSIGYAQSAIETIDNVASISHGLVALRRDLNRYSQLAARVVDQTERRIMLGEDVTGTFVQNVHYNWKLMLPESICTLCTNVPIIGARGDLVLF